MFEKEDTSHKMQYLNDFFSKLNKNNNSLFEVSKGVICHFPLNNGNKIITYTTNQFSSHHYEIDIECKKVASYVKNIFDSEHEVSFKLLDRSLVKLGNVNDDYVRVFFKRIMYHLNLIGIVDKENIKKPVEFTYKDFSFRLYYTYNKLNNTVVQNANLNFLNNSKKNREFKILANHSFLDEKLIDLDNFFRIQYYNEIIGRTDARGISKKEEALIKMAYY